MWIRALRFTACTLSLDGSAVAAGALIRKMGQSGAGHMEVKLRRSTRNLSSKSTTITKCVLADASIVKDVTNGSEANEEAQQLPSLRDKLIVLENETRLNTLKMAELRGIMKQIGRSTTGTKKMLLQELAKFLHPESSSSEGQVSIQVVSEKKTSKRILHEMEDGCRIEKSRKKAAKPKTIEIVDASDSALKSDQPWMVLVHKKPKPEWVPYNPCTMRPQTVPVGSKLLKVVSWNVNGLRALLKRKDEGQEVGSALARLAETEDFDIICLQETKLQEKDVEAIKCTLLANYSSSFWTCSISKLGYSGSAFISRMTPLSVTYGLGNPVHDTEGRIVTAEFDSFFLVTAYVPNSGQRLERLEYRTTEWDPAFSTFLMELQKRKPVVLTGDLNCAHQEIDIHDPDRNRRSAGFTDQERSSFEAQFLKKGLVDTFRKQHPHVVGFTYWNYRTNARYHNKGWRLDYFLVSEALASNVVDSYTLPHIDGSDHCPIGLILNLAPTLRA